MIDQMDEKGSKRDENVKNISKMRGNYIQGDIPAAA
jgi:hypothetical protein